MLIIVCGLQGTGKTYIARRIAEILKAEMLRTDVIRKELLRETSYAGRDIQNIYQEMFTRAEKLLQQKKDVVLDATFLRNENRISASNMAIVLGTTFKTVEVTCNEDIVKQRLRARSGDESDADYSVYLKYKSLYEPIPEYHIIIDNSGTREETDHAIDALLPDLSDSFSS